MRKMKNVSERKFTIAGKDLKQGEVGEFAQSVIEQHIAAYPLELVAVEGGEKEVESPKEETKPVVYQKEPETEDKVSEAPVVKETLTTETVEEVEKVSEDAPAPKRRGRKPKAKE